MSVNGEERSWMVDGNAAAGTLYDIFCREMTVAPTECAACGLHGEVGSLHAFIQAPGVVLRCPACGSVMVRMTRTSDAIYLDARGALYLRIAI